MVESAQRNRSDDARVPHCARATGRDKIVKFEGRITDCMTRTREREAERDGVRRRKCTQLRSGGGGVPKGRSTMF